MKRYQLTPAAEADLGETQVLWDQLKLPILWENAHTPPSINPSILLLHRIWNTYVPTVLMRRGGCW